MALLQGTLQMSAGAGKSVDFVTALGMATLGATFVKVLAKADCWVKFADSTSGESTTAPSATPAPGAGNSAPWIHLAASGELAEYDGNKGANGVNFKPKTVTHLLVWGIAAGDLVITGS